MRRSTLGGSATFTVYQIFCCLLEEKKTEEARPVRLMRRAPQTVVRLSYRLLLAFAAAQRALIYIEAHIYERHAHRGTRIF